MPEVTPSILEPEHFESESSHEQLVAGHEDFVALFADDVPSVERHSEEVEKSVPPPNTVDSADVRLLSETTVDQEGPLVESITIEQAASHIGRNVPESDLEELALIAAG